MTVYDFLNSMNVMGYGHCEFNIMHNAEVVCSGEVREIGTPLSNLRSLYGAMKLRGASMMLSSHPKYEATDDRDYVFAISI